jgi:hypothetical protein
VAAVAVLTNAAGNSRRYDALLEVKPAARRLGLAKVGWLVLKP